MSTQHSLLARCKRALAATALGAMSLVLAIPPASAYADGPWFVAGKPYVTTSQWVKGQNITIGDLADPDIYF